MAIVLSLKKFCINPLYRTLVGVKVKGMSKNQTLLVLKGLPASGKSTFAKSLVDKGWVRVNKDDLRDMMHNYKFSKDNEAQVIQVRNFIVLDALRLGKNVVVDDTNLDPVHEKTMREFAGSFPGVKVEVKLFEVDPEEAVRRDAVRVRPVGRKVIYDMWNRYLKPNFDRIPHDPLLPTCILVDMDGTMAIMAERGPYETDKYETDKINYPVSAAADAMLQSGVEVIFFSARFEAAREQTERWLWKHGWVGHSLFLRDDGDVREDSLVKTEMFRKHIEGKYNVLFVLDDRNRVVANWRKLGIPCFQVADGAF
jgi:predicted kinase